MTPEPAAARGAWNDDDGPIPVVPFPSLDPAALQGLAGKIVEAVMPRTEAHPAAILIQLLARFGCTVGSGPHVWVDNRSHPARINALIIGRTADGAKGTSAQVVDCLFSSIVTRPVHSPLRRLTAVGARHGPLCTTSGLSSGEGLIELVRDPSGDNPSAKGFDEGVDDKRLYVVEPEFTAVLSVMERQGSILPRVVREAWDGDTLRTLTRSPLTATDPHITIVGHVTPGELRIRLKEAQLVGGTMNRFLPIASRRTKLCPDGGNIPAEITAEYGAILAEALETAEHLSAMTRTRAADQLWHASYAYLRRSRPDGPVASMLARAVPQVLRLSLAYALVDGCTEIDEDHLHAALALWRYAEDTAGWLFGGQLDTGAVDELLAYIAAARQGGRTRSQISIEHYQRHKTAAEIDTTLSDLIRDGRVRQETDASGPGRPVTRYRA